VVGSANHIKNAAPSFKSPRPHHLDRNALDDEIKKMPLKLKKVHTISGIGSKPKMKMANV